MNIEFNESFVNSFDDTVLLVSSATVADLFNLTPATDVVTPLAVTVVDVALPTTSNASTSTSATTTFWTRQADWNMEPYLIGGILLVLIILALFVLCFLLRKYCQCDCGMTYSLNYGKAAPTEVVTAKTFETSPSKLKEPQTKIAKPVGSIKQTETSTITVDRRRQPSNVASSSSERKSLLERSSTPETQETQISLHKVEEGRASTERKEKYDNV